MESFCTNVLESYTVISANAMHIEIQESIHNLSKSNMREIFAFLHTRVKTKQQLKSFRRFIRQTSSSSNHSKIESITDLDKKINDLKNKEKQLNEKIEKLTNNIDRLSSIVTEKENAAQFQESIISKSKCNILSLREKSLQLATILKNAKEHISWCQGNANSLKELGSFVPSVNNRQKISQILCGLEEAVVVGLANHQNLNLKPIILNNVSQVELVGHFLTTTAVNIEFSRCQDNNCFTPNIVHNIRLNQVNDFKKFQKLGEKNKNNETIISEFEAVIRKNTSNALCMEKKSKLKLMTKINQFLKNYVLEKAKLRDFGFDYKLLESLNEDIKYKIKSKNVSKTKINALSNSILENFEGVKILRKENNEYGDILQQQLANFMAVLGTFKSSTITTARSFLLLQENKKNSSKFETEHVAILNTLNFPSFLNHTEIFQHIGKKKDFINFIKFFFMKNGIDWNSSKIENCSFTNIFSTDSLVIEKNDAVIAELIGKIKNNYEFYKTEIIPLLNDSITKSLEKCIAFNEMKEFESEWANYHQFLTRISINI
ncbi:hypothetical protein HDU92_008946 [Lobulomyces angularis]|nr:hypothetical protein HDU92_008946 [Lobulomyces angularis]